MGQLMLMWDWRRNVYFYCYTRRMALMCGMPIHPEATHIRIYSGAVFDSGCGYDVKLTIQAAAAEDSA